MVKTNETHDQVSNPLIDGRVQRTIVWLLLAVIVLRYAFGWVDAFAGASLPRLGSIGFTAVFTAFSVLHAADVLGWRRALFFFFVCVVVSWCFEAVGVTTGMIYGHYHYSDALGGKIAGVPVVIPLAWFMMVYASWIVSHILLEGTSERASVTGVIARAVVAATVMTSWDVVMDPGAAKSGRWIWENGGAYFGVPFQNFIGWMATTLTVYLVWALSYRNAFGPQVRKIPRIHTGAPALAYAVTSIDQVLMTPVPELHVVAAFGMCFISLLTILRLVLGHGALTLPAR
jgi:putative membrane protein